MTTHPEFVGLSCFTANLATYLATDHGSAAARFADSIRLAVRTDLPDGELAFSHHRVPLDRLPDGTRLRYATAADRDGVLAGLTDELARYGQVLVVTDNARLPWSPSFGTTATAPHWLLLAGRDGADWRVVDAFAGLLPTGEQLPFTGTLTTAHLLDAMAPSTWTPGQERRCALAFGFQVPTSSGSRWLQRSPDDAGPDDLPGEWLLTDDTVLPYLADYLLAGGDRVEPYLDDLWTAAVHRTFRYRRLGDQPAAEAWSRLPSALRFAIESARRGKPRMSLLDTTFRHLLFIESGQEALLPSAEGHSR
jgi:hypothetical protein